MNAKDYTLNHQQELIVRMLKDKTLTAEQIAQNLGKGYTVLKAQSMVLTLARKGLIDGLKAALILRGTPMAKFLGRPFGSARK